MILASLSDPFLRKVARHGARPDEDLFWEEHLVLDALDRGFPRLLVQGPDHAILLHGQVSAPVLRLDEKTLRSWEKARRDHEIPPRKVEFFGNRLRRAMEASARDVSWIDGTLRDLTRAAAASLPDGFKGMGRRVMEYPARYRTLKPMEKATGLSPGSLKGRFRRRELESPFVYLRWFRSVAVVHGLTRLELSYRQAAYRFGFSGSANLCRFLETTTGLTAAQLTESQGRERLLARFVSRLLDPEALAGWQDLDRVFLRQVA